MWIQISIYVCIFKNLHTRKDDSPNMSKTPRRLCQELPEVSKAGGFFRREVFGNPNGFGGCCDGYIPSLKLTAQIAPENGPFNPKGNFIIFQPLEFPGAFAVSFREDIYIYIYSFFKSNIKSCGVSELCFFFPLQHIWGETNVKNHNFFFRSFFSGDLRKFDIFFFTNHKLATRLESLNCPPKKLGCFVPKNWVDAGFKSPKSKTKHIITKKTEAKQIITNFLMGFYNKINHHQNKKCWKRIVLNGFWIPKKFPPGTSDPLKVRSVHFRGVLECLEKKRVISIWSNYSDLTRPHPKWWLNKGNPLISGKPRFVKYYNLARFQFNTVSLPETCNHCNLATENRWLEDDRTFLFGA